MYNEPLQTATATSCQEHQARRFDELTQFLRSENPYYRDKWQDVKAGRLDFAHLEELPFTTKSDLQREQREHPPFGRNLSFPINRYIRYHQTSGSTGTPLRIPDTSQDWEWWAACWTYILDAAGVTEADRVMLAFSFGPFIGFWSAQEAVARVGAMMLSGGGMTSAQRLAFMRDLEATVLLCTPSYALHLGEIAQAQGMNPARDLALRVAIHAGEPGAGIPATRERLESLWGYQAFDHPGASEVGAYAYSCSARDGVHINEAEFIAEVINPETGEPLPPGETGELVLTNLGRKGFPVVRYRTRDMVRARQRGTCSCGRSFLLLEGGILGRTDDMVTVRGVNIFPAAFLELFNTIPGVTEHRVTAWREGHMDQIHVEFEDTGSASRVEEIGKIIRERLAIRVTLEQHPSGALPRFEMKAKRFFDRRDEGWRPPAG